MSNQLGKQMKNVLRQKKWCELVYCMRIKKIKIWSYEPELSTQAPLLQI